MVLFLHHCDVAIEQLLGQSSAHCPADQGRGSDVKWKEGAALYARQFLLGWSSIALALFVWTCETTRPPPLTRPHQELVHGNEALKTNLKSKVCYCRLDHLPSSLAVCARVLDCGGSGSEQPMQPWSLGASCRRAKLNPSASSLLTPSCCPHWSWVVRKHLLTSTVREEQEIQLRCCKLLHTAESPISPA